MGGKVRQVFADKVLKVLTDGCMFDVMERDSFFLGKVSEVHDWGTVERYLRNRDGFHATARNPRTARWEKTTVRLAAGMWCNRSASLAKRGH
jgi:hypothetical protein